MVIDSKKYYFCELCQWFSLESVLQTNGVTESDMKEVIKKLIKNGPNGKVVKKNANGANYMINTTNVD